MLLLSGILFHASAEDSQVSSERVRSFLQRRLESLRCCLGSLRCRRGGGKFPSRLLKFSRTPIGVPWRFLEILPNSCFLKENPVKKDGPWEFFEKILWENDVSARNPPASSGEFSEMVWKDARALY